MTFLTYFVPRLGKGLPKNFPLILVFGDRPPLALKRIEIVPSTLSLQTKRIKIKYKNDEFSISYRKSNFRYNTIRMYRTL